MSRIAQNQPTREHPQLNLGGLPAADKLILYELDLVGWCKPRPTEMTDQTLISYKNAVDSNLLSPDVPAKKVFSFAILGASSHHVLDQFKKNIGERRPGVHHKTAQNAR